MFIPTFSLLERKRDVINQNISHNEPNGSIMKLLEIMCANTIHAAIKF
jgi:hypothetical protein